MSERRRVLIVEDSSSCRLLLEAIVEDDPRLELAGSVESAEDAMETLEELQPDVISLDIELPGMDGLAATRQVMQTHPTPIVIVSSTVSKNQVATSMKAMEAGALAVLAKPGSPGEQGFEREAAHMCSTLFGMSQVKVIRQYAHRQPGARSSSRHPQAQPAKSSSLFAKVAPSVGQDPSQVIAVGASTGGPPALEQFLRSLSPENCPPVLIVQHMSPGFVEGLASWLADRSGHDVQLATEGEPLQPGKVRLAPDGFHLVVTARGKLHLKKEPAGGLHCPSVDELFVSVAMQMVFWFSENVRN